MAAFLSVLSVIGHILLIVLVVLAAVLLVILFVPVRYRLNGRITDPENRDEPLNMEMLLQRTTADFSFFWLIHLVRGGISYPQKPKFTVKILWFTVFGAQNRGGKKTDGEKTGNGDNKKHRSHKVHKNHEKNGGDDSASGPGTEQDPGAEESGTEKEPEIKTDSDDAGRDKDDTGKDAEKKKETASGSGEAAGSSRMERLRCKLQAFCGKMKRISRNIRYYLSILESPRFEAAFNKVKDKVLRLLKKVLPSKWMLRGTVGFGDPEKAGLLMEAMGILWPLTAGHMDVTPEFYQYRCDLEFHAKGKIFIITLLVLFLQLYFDKNVKIIYHALRKDSKKTKKSRRSDNGGK